MSSNSKLISEKLKYEIAKEWEVETFKEEMWEERV